MVSGPPAARLLQHELGLPSGVGARTHPRGAPSARGRLSSFSTPLGLTAPPRYLTSILTPVGHMPPTHLHTLTKALKKFQSSEMMPLPDDEALNAETESNPVDISGKLGGARSALIYNLPIDVDAKEVEDMLTDGELARGAT